MSEKIIVPMSGRDESSGTGYILRFADASGTRLNSPTPRGTPIAGKSITARIAADAILRVCSEYGDLLSNLKLQRILYYCQSWYLAVHGKPLFPDRFEAWVHGPVQPETYAHFSMFGHGPIVSDVTTSSVPKKVTRHIEEVLEVYGSMSAIELQRRTQTESPWIEARHGLAPDEPSNAIISHDSMMRYYRVMLNEQAKGQD